MTNNILPKIWGPHGWKFMHFVALGYPDTPTDQDKSSYQRFFESLQDVLPCQSCANHYQETLRKYPIDLSNRESLLQWTFTIHNEVNRKTGKPLLSHEDALGLYTHTQFPFLKIIGLILILILMYVIIRR
jgi:hypothetical protein